MSVYGLFPLAPATIVVNPNNTSVTVTGLQRGVKYRVVSTVACNIQYGFAATGTTGMHLPAGVEHYFVFGMADSQGTNLDVRVFAASSAFVYFTPMVPVVGG
jgi:hypothetical protein